MHPNLEQRLGAYGFTARDIAILAERCGGALRSLADIKTLLNSYGYDYDCGRQYEVRSALTSLRGETLSCINAAVLAHALLGVLLDQTRILLAIHRRDPDNVECGHVVAVGELRGQCFALGKSNYPALNGVYGPFPNRDKVALAFGRAYMSMGFTPLYYGFFDPEDCCSKNDLAMGDTPLNQLCEFMVSNYQYAYSVRTAQS